MEDDWLEPDENAPELEEIPEGEDILANIPPLGADKLDTIKQIVEAKKKSTQRAGLVKTTESGSTWEEDEVEEIKIPSSGIHEFENMDECVCDCHPSKKDCMNCYDHPEHLTRKRNMNAPKKEEYDQEKITALIEADKAKKNKKHFWQRDKTPEIDEK